MRLGALPLFAAAALSRPAGGVEEEAVAMLQTAGRQGLEQRAFVQHKEALDRLLHSTENMLRKGASEDVIALAEETLKALKAEVLPMIEQAHKAQTSLVSTHYEAVVNFLNSYSDDFKQLMAQWVVESNASAKHKECRLSEYSTVTQRRTCSEELAVLWEQVTELEDDLTNIESVITEEWCEPGVNTSVSHFREGSVHHFNKYTEKRTKVTVAWRAYTVAVPSCQIIQQEYHERNEQCDSLQQELETASCLSATLADHAARSVDDGWRVVRGAFTDTVASVTDAVASRKHEYSVLKVVQCLIEKIREVGGRPCEEQEAGTNVTADVEIRHCHEISESVTHLDIEIPVLPPDPSKPEEKPAPCTSEFIAQEYADFPEGVEVAECRPCLGNEFALVHPPPMVPLTPEALMMR